MFLPIQETQYCLAHELIFIVSVGLFHTIRKLISTTHFLIHWGAHNSTHKGYKTPVTSSLQI